MLNVKKEIARILPEKVKNIIRPRYRRFAERDPDRSSRIAIGSFGGFEIAYRKDTADELVIGDSFDNDKFFSETPEYQPDTGHVIIEIGAHIGTFSLLSSSKIGHGKVYAIEASEDSFNLLRINVALNQPANISVHHLAIADKEGRCTLYHDAGNWGNSTVKRLSESSETVNACTLSAFLDRNRINECHFLKLNCEGGEFPILLSTPNNVLQRFGTILVLYHCDLWSNNTEDDLISHLESSGLNCVIRNRSEKRGWIIATGPGKMTNKKDASSRTWLNRLTARYGRLGDHGRE
ncbi:MAG TPA: FkbM family methyltransferase [Actinobacteria bacterium]|nr:FkbM family methyltransferase [Actinomycetota bacterium]